MPYRTPSLGLSPEAGLQRRRSRSSSCARRRAIGRSSGEKPRPPTTAMATDGRTVTSSSLFARMIGRQRPAWATLVLVLLIYLPTLATAYQLGMTDILDNPDHRSILTAPTAIAYILLIGPILVGMEPIVIRSLRPTILLDDQELVRVVQRASGISPILEIGSIALGLTLGLLIVPTTGEIPPAVVATNFAMLGLLGWTGFYSVAGTRVVSTLLRQPMRVDPLDVKPFESIGRQSLAYALAFVGGITISLLLGNYSSSALVDFRFWLLYLPLSLIPVAVFFLNMRPTHRVLAKAKDGDLTEVRWQLHHAYWQLLERGQAGQPAGELPSVIAALATFEKALVEARTWPYNTATARTLALSILIPIVSVLARRVFEVYIR